MKSVQFAEHGGRMSSSPATRRRPTWGVTRCTSARRCGETARAHELLENREGFGKVVVVPDSEQ